MRWPKALRSRSQRFERRFSHPDQGGETASFPPHIGPRFPSSSPVPCGRTGYSEHYDASIIRPLALMKALQVPCLRPDVVVDDTAKLVQLVLKEDEFLSTVVDQSWRLFGQLRWQVAGDPWDRQQRRGGAGRPHPHREDQRSLPVPRERHAGRILGPA